MVLRNKLDKQVSSVLEQKVMLAAPAAFDLSPFGSEFGSSSEPVGQAEPTQQAPTQDFGSFDLNQFGFGGGSEPTFYPGENYDAAISSARIAGYEPVGYFHTHPPFNGQPASTPPSGGDIAFLTDRNIVAPGNGLVRDTAGNTYYYFATGETVSSYDSVLQEWNGYFNSGNRDAYIPTATNNGIAVYYGGSGDTILNRLN